MSHKLTCVYTEHAAKLRGDRTWAAQAMLVQQQQGSFPLSSSCWELDFLTVPEDFLAMPEAATTSRDPSCQLSALLLIRSLIRIFGADHITAADMCLAVFVHIVAMSQISVPMNLTTPGCGGLHIELDCQSSGHAARWINVPMFATLQDGLLTKRQKIQ